MQECHWAFVEAHHYMVYNKVFAEVKKYMAEQEKIAKNKIINQRKKI